MTLSKDELHRRLRAKTNARYYARRKARLSAEPVSEVPLVELSEPTPEGLPVSESGQEAERVAAKPASAKRYKYTVDEFGDRWTDVPDLSELEALYRQTYGEDLPTWARTRRVGGDPYPQNPTAELVISIHAAEQAARADEELRQSNPTAHAAQLCKVDPSRIEWVNWKGEPMEGDPKELLAAGKLIVATVRPKPGVVPAQRSEFRRIESLIRTLAGPLESPENTQ